MRENGVHNGDQGPQMALEPRRKQAVTLVKSYIQNVTSHTFS
jgi:hypothetical protein